MTRTACLMAFAFMIVLINASWASAQHSFTEDFTTTTYQGPGTNSLDWNTADGELRFEPFAPSVAGAVATSGNSALGIDVAGQHAYVADGNDGLQVIEISTPNSPVIVGSYNTAGFAYDVHVAGPFAYVASHAGGLQVVDISDPTAPVLAGVSSTPGFALGIYIEGNYAYVGDGTAGLSVVDISDPTLPTVVGNVDTAGDAARNIAVAGNHAYVVDGSGGLVVVDITNPFVPSIVAVFPTPGYAFDVVVAGHYAYVTLQGWGLFVVDISDPASPAKAGTYYAGTTDFYGLQIAGDHLYLAHDVAGLLVLDLTNPTSLVLEHLVDTPGHARDVFIADEHIFVSDLGSGLQSIVIRDLILPYSSAPNNGVGPQFVVDGNYLYSATRSSGLMVSDITLPMALQEVILFDTGADVRDVCVSGDHAYLASYATGMQVVDISDPASPVLVGVVDTPGFAARVTVSGNIAYVADEDSGLQMIDISNPLLPVLVGAHATVGEASHVAISGDLAIVSRTTSALDFVDVTDPAAPILLQSFALGNIARSVFIEGNYAYVAGGPAGVNIIDISDPAAPVLVTTVDMGSAVWNVYVSGGRAYVAEDTGFQEIKVLDPTAPSLYYNKTYGEGFSYSPRRIYAAGDHVYVGTSFGVKIEQVYQSEVDLSNSSETSSLIDIGPGPIVRARATTVQNGSIDWFATFGDGYPWSDLLPNTWAEVYGSDATLRWSSYHEYVPGTLSAVSNLTIEWLYDYATIEAVRDVPNDQGRQVSLEWARSGHDFVGDATQVVEYAVYRQIDWSLATKLALTAKSGILSVPQGASTSLQENIQAMQSAGWHFLTTVPVLVEDKYAVVVPTLADSTAAAGVYQSIFKVVALTATPGVFFTSLPDSGSSVDNLAPSVPLAFTAAYAADGVDLVWSGVAEPDFRYYRIYRGTDPGFIPGTGNLVQEIVTSMWTDTTGSPWSYYYKVTAVDFSGNESPAAEVLSASDALPTGAAFVLHNAVPNPFNPATRINYSLAVGGKVRLAIYDVAGRLVRTLVDNVLPAGDHHVGWDGRDQAGQALASGTYFSLLRSGENVQRQPMLLMK